jgi:hypothetical protein
MGPSRIVYVATWYCDRWCRGVIRSIIWMASGVARVEEGRLARVLISLELFDSRPLNLHLLDLVCVVNITFCSVLVFYLIFRS